MRRGYASEFRCEIKITNNTHSSRDTAHDMYIYIYVHANTYTIYIHI